MNEGEGEPMSTRAVAVPVTNLWASPDAVRDVDKPALIDTPDPRAWPDALGNEERVDLYDRVDSQLLLGEPVEVIDEDGDWVKIIAPWQPSREDPRGYPGWVRRAHLASPGSASDREAVVTVDSAVLQLDDGSAEATFGSVLPALDDADGHVRVALPGGATAWLSKSLCDVRPVPADRATAEIRLDAVIPTARRFEGLQYLWGGLCAYGVDCSGLVHLTYRALGRVVPRDAHDQAEAGLRVDRTDARPGDLLFFQREGKGIHHVGFALDDPDRMLHAPGTGNPVADDPIEGERRDTILDYVARYTA